MELEPILRTGQRLDALARKAQHRAARVVPVGVVPHLDVAEAAGRKQRSHVSRAVARLAALLINDVAAAAAVAGGLRWGPWPAPGVVTLALALSAGLMLTGAYRRGDAWFGYRTVTAGGFIGGVSAWGAHLVMSDSTFSATGTVLGVAVLTGLVLVGRRTLVTVARHDRSSLQTRESVLAISSQLVGNDHPLAAVTDSLPWDVQHVQTPMPGMETCGSTAVVRAIRDAGADTVLLLGDASPALRESVTEAGVLAGCRVLCESKSPGRSSIYHGDFAIDELSHPAARMVGFAAKRSIDVLLSAAALVVVAVPCGLIAWMVRLDSKGPILFRQIRVGHAGRLFEMLKFRTMTDGAHDAKQDLAHLNASGDPRLFKVQDDPRVTRFGRILRRWSLDELPQLWNVLRGDMSLVGPRPFFDADLEMYEERHFVRLCARPGITGLWQIEHRNNEVDFERVVELDRRYVTDWSLALDARILASTLPAILSRTADY